jgi:hypothetical protein
VPDNGSILVVPLRSNAYTLLTGALIAAMRRRLKFVSLFYDRLILETGIFVAIHPGRTAAGSQGPVVKSWVSASRASMPHLVAVDR